MKFLLKKIIIGALIVWQKIFSAQTGLLKFLYLTPLLNLGGTPQGCRYWPSCSEYTKEALKRYPLGRAIKISASRITRCHHHLNGGYDPLPKRP